MINGEQDMLNSYVISIKDFQSPYNYKWSTTVKFFSFLYIYQTAEIGSGALAFRR